MILVVQDLQTMLHAFTYRCPKLVITACFNNWLSGGFKIHVSELQISQSDFHSVTHFRHFTAGIYPLLVSKLLSLAGALRYSSVLL